MDKDNLLEQIPHLNPDNLLGGTFSPEDGCASPLRTAASYFEQAKRFNTCFKFNEIVIDISEKSHTYTVKTNKNSYNSNILINAAGGNARKINQLLGIDLPVNPDSHEGAVTEPIKKIPHPMIVDMRGYSGSSNVYFHQLPSGQYILCLTPSPIQLGSNERATSQFLPLLAERVLRLIPSLSNIRIRRTWRGLYPMTPDGMPILGESKENMYQAIGMCGQGFMLGPGVAQTLSRAIIKDETIEDEIILSQLSPFRNFDKIELLK